MDQHPKIESIGSIGSILLGSFGGPGMPSTTKNHDLCRFPLTFIQDFVIGSYKIMVMVVNARLFRASI